MATLRISDQAYKDMIVEVVEYGGYWAFMNDNETKDQKAHDVVISIIQRFVDDQIEQKDADNDR
ncbi:MULTISPECIES: hypothetical protein [Psychrobacter]|uniref:hypothetical protein n=1 Tax=Psychrobacter TaxID=497 RepID=UPI000C7ED91B|nr:MULTISPECIES: hypothetical protein [Psychrobacter]PLT21295.1 hypothetical protein CXF62_11005 [Psychrobacter sp. MES7-P7E]